MYTNMFSLSYTNILLFDPSWFQNRDFVLDKVTFILNVSKYCYIYIIILKVICIISKPSANVRYDQCCISYFEIPTDV